MNIPKIPLCVLNYNWGGSGLLISNKPAESNDEEVMIGEKKPEKRLLLTEETKSVLRDWLNSNLTVSLKTNRLLLILFIFFHCLKAHDWYKAVLGNYF